MIKHLSKLARQTEREVRWWAYGAWTMPFVALACLMFINFVGWDSILEKAFVVVASVFFGVSVFWWWWAIHKFAAIFNVFVNTEKELQEVKEHISETRRIIQEEINDVGNRQR